MVSLVMLVSWDLWNELNARVFKNKSSMVASVLTCIKLEVRTWDFVGAKHLSHGNHHGNEVVK
jgi:ABC-type uncharacterized transport system ATPase subunit